MPEVKLSANQKACLEVLVDAFGDEANCLYFRTVAARTGLEERVVRLAVRALARKGYTRWERGLFDMDALDGKLAGSGYCATREGKEALKLYGSRSA